MDADTWPGVVTNLIEVLFAGYGSNALSGMTKATLDPHGHLRQPGMNY